MGQATWHFTLAAAILVGTAWQPSCQFAIHFNRKFKHLPGKILSEM